MATRHSCQHPPSRKKGWEHSEQVLVYYEANAELNLTDRWGIAYYHYSPPFEEPAGWVDFCSDRVPSYWWELPTPND